MLTYFFETYGCEMNIAESAAVEQLFIARGWQKSESAQTADVAVINTCSIRETAENRILGRLGWFSGLKAVRECKTGAKTVLTSCLGCEAALKLFCTYGSKASLCASTPGLKISNTTKSAVATIIFAIGTSITPLL